MIIWNNLKVTNGTNTVTLSASGIQGLHGLSISGNFSAAGDIISNGTLSGQQITGHLSNVTGSLNQVTGTFAGSLNSARGTFAGSLSDATGTINNITCKGLTTLNNVSFTQSVNLPSGSTINSQPIGTTTGEEDVFAGLLVFVTSNPGIQEDQILCCNLTDQNITPVIAITTKDIESHTDTFTLPTLGPGEVVRQEGKTFKYNNITKITVNGTEISLYSDLPSWLTVPRGLDNDGMFRWGVYVQNFLYNRYYREIGKTIIGDTKFAILKYLSKAHATSYEIKLITTGQTSHYELVASNTIDIITN